jgi:hypothetical protein
LYRATVAMMCSQTSCQTEIDIEQRPPDCTKGDGVDPIRIDVMPIEQPVHGMLRQRGRPD